MTGRQVLKEQFGAEAEGMFDVIVVGAGPAGAAAAYWLGEAGCRVLILEKAWLPRYKPCGGAVPAGGLKLLPFDFAPIVQTWVRRVRYSLDGHEDVSYDLPGPGVAMVMRDRFDAFLVAQSRAEVRDGVAVEAVVEDEAGVTVKAATGESLRGRYLIGADGANSRVAWALGLRRARIFTGAIEAEAPAPAHLLAEYANTGLFRFRSVHYGYAWVFPKGDHLSIGVGGFIKDRLDLRGALRREAQRLGLSLDGVPIHGHPLPIYCYPEPVHSRRTLLVGDAAGMVDGFIGEGIRYAIHSGRLAAQTILTGDIAGYSRLIQRELGHNLTWARRCGHVFYRFTDFCFHHGVRNPRTTRVLIDVLNGRRTYRDAVWPVLGCIVESLMRGI